MIKIKAQLTGFISNGVCDPLPVPSKPVEREFKHLTRAAQWLAELERSGASFTEIIIKNDESE